MEMFNKNKVEDDVDLGILKVVIRHHWIDPNGVKVTFEKKDGSIRNMIIKLNEDLLKAKDPEDPRTIARRKTNKENHNLVVTEFLPESSTYQIRTVPLEKVIAVETV